MLFEKGYVVLSLVFLSSLIIITFSIINKKFSNKAVDVITKTFCYLFGISYGLLLIILFGMILFLSYYLLYFIFFIIFKVVFSKEISTFLALFGSLALGMYFPDKVGFTLLKILEIFTKYKFSNIYIALIKFLRLKIWIYLFAFLITIISSIESINGSIITLSIWVNIKPYIMQAVVAFIAFDRFINIFKTQLPDIKKDVKNVMIYFRSNEKDKDV